ncbi:hypothetical protein RED65_15858 [Bermanella marisrubri]|uniref:Uncharacterized protein n=1 Tax=Bermanella marisrubri TaxID=207949 RepID=Q1N235_9GAMM|nr:hypothetical protein RED65_15858 [Bermanella marisrubri]
MKNLLLVILLFFVTAHSNSESLCLPSEKTYFSCATKKNKFISVCGSPKIKSNQRSYIQYRYGTFDNIELEYPKDRKGSLNSFSFTHYFRSQYDLTELEFVNSDYQYSIFWIYDGESKQDRKVDSGIRIKKVGTQKKFKISCSSQIIMNLADLEDLVPCNKSNPLAFC